MLDARTIVLVAAIALGAFGLQLAFLAGTVASPLGGAIADFDRIPQVVGAPPEALARASEDARPAREVTRAAPLPWEGSPAVAVGYRPAPPECPADR